METDGVEPQAPVDDSPGVAQALLLLEAVDVVGAGVTQASESKDSGRMEPLLLAAGLLGPADDAGAAAGVARLKRSPRPADEVELAGMGLAGAKKPPEAGLDSCGAAEVFFIPAVRLANGDGLGGAAWTGSCEPKPRPLNELFRSPNNADGCCCCCCCGAAWSGGDGNPGMVGLSCRDWWCWWCCWCCWCCWWSGGGRGADA